MRRVWVCGVAVLLLGACGGEGNDDKAACEALRNAQGDNADIYDDLRGMDLSDELRSALAELGQASAGEEISPEAFERGATVMGHCAEEGVRLSG